MGNFMPETDESVDDETVVEKPETETEETVEEAAPEGEETTEEPDEGEEESAPSRRESRVAALARRTREAEERALRAEAERDAERRTRQPLTNPEEARRVRDEKLALMDPQERRDFMRDEELKELKNGMAMTQFRMQDSLDKAAFQQKALVSKAAKRLEGKVEEEYQKALRNGNFVPRASLFAYLRGLELEEIESRPPSKQTQAAKKAAAERVDGAKLSRCPASRMQAVRRVKMNVKRAWLALKLPSAPEA